MTEEEIRLLISHGETLDVEFKGEEKQPLNDTALVEAVVCLANRSGNQPGYLLVGVEDDGRITGTRPRHSGGKTDPLQIQALIANRTRPSLTCQVKEIPVEGHSVLVIMVPPSRTPTGTTDGKYLRRAMGGKGIPECRPFHFHEMQALQADRGILDYSVLAVPDISWDDLEPLEFERFRRFIRESRGQGDTTLLDLPDIELAKALGAVEANGEIRAVRILGLLLFGREDALRRHLPTHEAALQVLEGTKVKVNDFFRWPLLRLMEEFLGRFRALNREDELMVGMLRVGVPDYPERAFSGKLWLMP
jgi:ATP-dependent DNA helicase RecG